MAAKSDFSADDWSTLQRAMVGAAVLVAGADGGSFETVKEAMAASRTFQDAHAQSPSTLVKDLADPAGLQPGFPPGIARQELESAALEAMRSSVSLLTTEAPEEVGPFRDLVVSVAQSVAEAGESGGFLGIGGKKVSEAETAMIAKIKDALGAS